MPAKRYLAHVDLHYPLNPDDPREDWQMVSAKAGEVVDNLPAQSIPSLLERGKVTVAGKDRSKLPDDFPARDLLIAEGMKSYADVERRYDGLSGISGIGPKTLADISAALIAPDDDEEGGE